MKTNISLACSLYQSAAACGCGVHHYFFFFCLNNFLYSFVHSSVSVYARAHLLHLSVYVNPVKDVFMCMCVCVCACVYVCMYDKCSSVLVCVSILTYKSYFKARTSRLFSEYLRVCYVSTYCVSLSLSRSLSLFLSHCRVSCFFFFFASVSICKLVEHSVWSSPRCHWQLRALRDAPRPFDDDNDHDGSPRLMDGWFHNVVRWDEVIRGHSYPRRLHRYPETQSVDPLEGAISIAFGCVHRQVRGKCSHDFFIEKSHLTTIVLFIVYHSFTLYTFLVPVERLPTKSRNIPTSEEKTSKTCSIFSSE